MKQWGIRSAKFCSTDPARAWGTEIPWVCVGGGWGGWGGWCTKSAPKTVSKIWGWPLEVPRDNWKVSTVRNGGTTLGSRNRGPAWSKSGSKLKRPGSCLEMCFGIEFWSFIWVLLHNSIMNRVCPFVSCTAYQAFGGYDILGLEYAIYAKYIARDALSSASATGGNSKCKTSHKNILGPSCFG